MSGIETIIAIGSAVSGLAGTALSAAGSIAAGQSEQARAEFEAKQREQQAQQARAVSQREALERRREQQLLQSRQLAAAAAAGGASDPSVIDIFADTAAQGELNVQREIATGEERARGLELGADVARFEGRRAQQAATISAGSQILGGVSNLYTRFGEDLFKKNRQPTQIGYYYG